MKVNIKATSGPISGIRYVRLTTNEDIAGSFNADCQTYALSAGAGDKYKTIDMDLGVNKSTDDNITVYFVLPPNTYSAGWKISLLDVDKKILAETKPAGGQMRIVRSKRITTNIDMTDYRPLPVLLINANSYTPWGLHKNATTNEEIKRIIGNGCFWDESGPAWQVGNLITYTTGLWIRVRNLDPTRTAQMGTPGIATADVRRNPDYAFIPAASVLRPGGTFDPAMGVEGHYWTNQFFLPDGHIGPGGDGWLNFSRSLLLMGYDNVKGNCRLSINVQGVILQ